MLTYLIRQFAIRSREASCWCLALPGTVLIIGGLLAGCGSLIGGGMPNAIVAGICLSFGTTLLFGFNAFYYGYTTRIERDRIPRRWWSFLLVQLRRGAGRRRSASRLIAHSEWDDIERFALDDIVQIGPAMVEPLLRRLGQEMAYRACDDCWRIIALLTRVSPDWPDSAGDFVAVRLVPYLYARLSPSFILLTNQDDRVARRWTRIGTHESKPSREFEMPYDSETLVQDRDALVWALTRCGSQVDRSLLQQLTEIPDLGVWEYRTEHETEYSPMEGTSTDWIDNYTEWIHLADRIGCDSVREAAVRQLPQDVGSPGSCRQQPVLAESGGSA